MGGTIDLESTFGKGTKMTVSIPLDKASSKTPDPLSAGPSRGPSPPNAYEPVDRSRIWILVAEDNELNREIVVRTLKKMKFNAKAVKDGREAIEAMSERLWDLVLYVALFSVVEIFGLIR
jgi:PleD family two-component response regulator